MFRALLAHLQEALHKEQLEWNWFHSNPGSSQPTQYARNIPTVVYAAPPEDEPVGFEIFRGC
jgi:hypothetical protein